MATTVLDAAAFDASAFPASFTISAGSNRIFFIFEMRGSGSNVTPNTGVTWGDQAMTSEGLADVVDHNVSVQLWSLKEAEIAAKTGDTITPSGGDGGNNIATFVVSIQGANQGALTVPTATSTASSGTLSITRVAESFTLAANCLNAANLGSMTNPAETLEGIIGGSTATYGDQTDGTGTSDVTWNNAFNRDNAILGVNVGPPDVNQFGVTDIDGHTSFTYQNTAQVKMVLLDKDSNDVSFTPVSNQSLILLEFYGLTNNVTPRTLDVGVYDITSGISGAPLLHKEAITFADVVADWRASSVISGVTLTAGQQYVVAISPDAALTTNLWRGPTTTNSGNNGTALTSLPASWIDNGNSTRMFAVRATYEPAVVEAGRTMGSLAGKGGLAGMGGIAGPHGGLAA